jgi:hypothetical protein
MTSSKERKGDQSTLTCVNLLDPGQSKSDFIPVHSRTVQLQRIHLEVHGFQILFVGQLSFNLSKISQFVAAGPQLLEPLQMSYILEVRDLIARDIQNT